NTAISFAATLDAIAEDQIRTVCDCPQFADCKIRIMPDVHAGQGCTIGTTMTLTDKVVPGRVGVDIGCGMETVRIAENRLDCDALDALIRRRIPCGREVRPEPHALNDQIDLNELRIAPSVKLDYARCSIGTLGGGNHFIEAGRDEDSAIWLVVHSGSRHLGTETANWYQEEGCRRLCGSSKKQIAELIERYKSEGRDREIQTALNELRAREAVGPEGLPRDLAYVEGELFDDYIHDMRIVQRFAALNRRAMMDEILTGLKLTAVERFCTVHNYIDTKAMILRKGAVSAKAGEKLLIPINMRDGSLICKGLGNEDWNCSAPHGAGRLMSRAAAFRSLSLDEYKNQMAGIYSTCISQDTLDESPMAYKSLNEIASAITPTARIITRVKPIYNFKAAE
ncbi:MAG: RtcB family protein, partial [Pyramidobacter sp.]|nr:RtcB family protein [Pyramidobacter sp.]